MIISTHILTFLNVCSGFINRHIPRQISNIDDSMPVTLDDLCSE